MSILTLGPETLVQEYQWLTDLIVSRNGNEQRVALRQIPRQVFKVTYLADSDEEIQYWKSALSDDLSRTWNFPLWHEAVQITAPVTASDVTVFADFTLMDDELGISMVILHPDEVTHEVFFPTLPRLAAEAPLASGSFDNSYPIGSRVIPIEECIINNNSSYAAMTVNAATLSLEFVARTYNALDGKGAAAIPTHTPDVTLRPGAPTVPLLDRRPSSTNAPSVFNEKIERVDYGGIVELFAVADVAAKIVNGRQYLSTGLLERQFWKKFINTIRGQQKSFYTSTHRPDMTIVNQPDIGGTSFTVLDDAPVADFWEDLDSHSELSLQTADGDTQLVTIDPVLTVDNFDGTHTVEFLPALTATSLGSTVDVVSFLELVRLGSDIVSVEYGHVSRKVNLSVRTIEA